MAVTPIYAAPITAANYEPTVNVLGPIEKIARQAVYNVIADDRLSPLEKGALDNGADVEQIVVQLAESTAYNPDSVTNFSASNPNLAVRYFKAHTERTYKVKIADKEIRKIRLAYSEEDIAGMIASSLTNGYIQENYEAIRDMFEDSDIRDTAVTLSATVENNDYKAILLAIKNAVSGMTFVNDDYNGAGIKRRTRLDDIVILMPYTIKNAIDVNELAGVFNLSKDELPGRMIEIDSANADFIYILDRKAAQIYTFYYGMESARNIDGKYTELNLTVDKMYALSPLFDVTAIRLVEPAAGE